MPPAVPAVAALVGSAAVSIWNNRQNRKIEDRRYNQQMALQLEDRLFDLRQGAAVAEAQAHAAREGGRIQASVYKKQGKLDSALYAEQAVDTGRIADLNIKNIRLEGAEVLRRLMRGNDQTESTVQARQGASGVKSNRGSAAVYSKEMRDEHVRQENWQRKSTTGLINVQIAEKNAAVRYYNTMSRNAITMANAQASAAIAQGDLQGDVASAQYHMYMNQIRRLEGPPVPAAGAPGAKKTYTTTARQQWRKQQEMDRRN